MRDCAIIFNKLYVNNKCYLNLFRCKKLLLYSLIRLHQQVTYAPETRWRINEYSSVYG